jgi:hypothetical protein
VLESEDEKKREEDINNNNGNDDVIDNSITIADDEIPAVVDSSLNGMMKLRKRVDPEGKAKYKDDLSS